MERFPLTTILLLVYPIVRLFNEAMPNLAQAANLLGRRSAQVRIQKWGKQEFVRRMREWGKLGGRPRSEERRPGKGSKSP